jgi:hypothetical protein
MKKILFISLLISFSALAQKEIKTDIEKEAEVIDYSNIQSVLKEDGLEKEAVLKKKLVQKVIKEKKVIKLKKYNYPRKEDFWSFMSELWIIKNA